MDDQAGGGRGVAFGVFDHLDASGAPLHALLEGRLKLAEVYDRCGFRGYHVAEHHGTPLGSAPAPSVLLSAMAQRTTRLRLGPLIYMLPMHHPLRLIEEICLLDQLSGGRLMLGVGRGVSPIEMGFYGLDVAESQARYEETLEIVLKGLAADRLDHAGRFYTLRDVPMTVRPFQRPHPELWYGVRSRESTAWAAANGINVVTLADAAAARGTTDFYRAEWARLGKPAAALPFMGVSRHVVVADTDAEAKAIAARAYRRWVTSFYHLWDVHGVPLPRAGLPPQSWDELEAEGSGCAGSGETVRRYVGRQVEEGGLNYLVAALAFGDMAVAEATRSAELFAAHVMPAFAGRPGG